MTDNLLGSFRIVLPRDVLARSVTEIGARTSSLTGSWMALCQAIRSRRVRTVEGQIEHHLTTFRALQLPWLALSGTCAFVPRVKRVLTDTRHAHTCLPPVTDNLHDFAP